MVDHLHYLDLVHHQELEDTYFKWVQTALFPDLEQVPHVI